MFHFGIAGGVSRRLTDGVSGAVGVAGQQRNGDGMGKQWWLLGALRRALTECRDGDEWLDQQRSPLAAHCLTVRARIEAGLPGARIDGDRYLLSTAALAEELSDGAT